MKKNYLTVIIQPDWGSQAKKLQPISSFHIPRRFIFYSLLSIVLLAAFGVCGSWEIRENVALKKKIVRVGDSIAGLGDIRSEVIRIRDEERIIREFLGIEAWDSGFDINDRMGKGGTGEESTFELDEISLNEEIERTETRTEPLHEQVHDLREDVNELIVILSKMTETLKCRPTIMPVKDDDIWITSSFGWRKSPFTGLREFHKGLDISGRKGAPLIATADGIVSKVGYNRFIGNYVRIKHDERFGTAYGHMLKYIVKKGDTVKRGQVIGYMGTTGMSTGYHVHYEVTDNEKRVNPYNFILNRHERKLASARK